MSTSNNPGRPMILIVDDEQDVLDSLADLLRKDYHVSTTTDVDEALRLLSSFEFALIITDQRMPQMAGTELLARAAQLSNSTIRILLTAYSDIEAVIQAINHGKIYYYFSKPWDTESLLEIVKEATLQHSNILERKHLIEDLKDLNQGVSLEKPNGISSGEKDQTSKDDNLVLLEAYQNLKTSYWLLSKIQEHLPVCMGCGKVKTTESQWQEALDYLKANSVLMTHGYCPDCSLKVEKNWSATEE